MEHNLTHYCVGISSSAWLATMTPQDFRGITVS